jgi:endonuclease/exonuclease/phosphatase (EEP) superfamily protein YafD
MGTLLPLFRGHHWGLRVFDFPRAQMLALGATLFGGGLCRWRRLARTDRVLTALAGAAAAGQAVQIYPYTRLAREEVLTVPEAAPGPSVILLCANVYQFNRRSRGLLGLIARHSPHMVLLTETDSWWANQLKELEAEYPFVVRKPLENTYGMMLYSKHELVDPEVRFLVQPDVPSIRTVVRLPENQDIFFYGVHPKPPGTETPEGDLRGSGARDTELVLVAREVGEWQGPTIVAGDFNDVAWSHTTRLFQRLSRLLDPRIGRGLFSTFPVNHPWFRYPLDHLFHSEHFSLVAFKRLPAIGSDHFPILAALKLTPQAAREQEPPRADEEDQEEAEQTVREAPKE